MTDGSLRPGQTVLIEGNRIATIGPLAEVDIPKGTEVVDAADGYLIPGLWDMHVHTARAGRARHFWPLFLAHGVTGVREMGSYLDSLQYWQAQAAQPGTLAPRIHWSSPMLDGAPPDYDHAFSLLDAEAARAAADSMQQLGFDFLKVYDWLPRATYFALAEEARERGFPFAGHVPAAVGVDEASDAGQQSLEHSRDLLIACTPGASALWTEVAEARATYGPASYSVQRAEERLLEPLAFLGPYPELCQPLFERFVANETWFTPTLTAVQGDLTPSTFDDDPRLRFVPPALAEAWRVERRLSPAQEAQVGQRILQNSMRLAALAQRAGVGILAGTDASDQPYIFAGSGLHDELTLLVEAGLSPLEALRAATLNPARFLGRTDELGTVEEGKLADLVLLDGNPLEDIRNTQRIRMVMMNGQVLDRKTLDAMLAKVEEIVQE